MSLHILSSLFTNKSISLFEATAYVEAHKLNRTMIYVWFYKIMDYFIYPLYIFNKNISRPIYVPCILIQLSFLSSPHTRAAYSCLLYQQAYSKCFKQINAPYNAIVHAYIVLTYVKHVLFGAICSVAACALHVNKIKHVHCLRRGSTDESKN